MNKKSLILKTSITTYLAIHFIRINLPLINFFKYFTYINFDLSTIFAITNYFLAIFYIGLMLVFLFVFESKNKKFLVFPIIIFIGVTILNFIAGIYIYIKLVDYIPSIIIINFIIIISGFIFTLINISLNYRYRITNIIVLAIIYLYSLIFTLDSINYNIFGLVSILLGFNTILKIAFVPTLLYLIFFPINEKRKKSNSYENLLEIKRLYDEGIINETEYEEKRQEYIKYL